MVPTEPYDPRVVSYFREEAARLEHHLGDGFIEFEHVGSTAVPGLAGSAVVDIQIGLFSLPAKDAVRLFGELGYQEAGEGAGGPRFTFRGERQFDVQLATLDDDVWRNNLALRDFLRSHPEEVRGLSLRKHDPSYADSKPQVLAELLQRASAWKANVESVFEPIWLRVSRVS